MKHPYKDLKNMATPLATLRRNFSNHRGLVRTLLADLMWRLGPYRRYGEVDWGRVQRLVFICQGNICRSPFAHYSALEQGSELPVVSFGLATTTGVPANSVAQSVAAEMGVDLSPHRATDMQDFGIRDGDLLIVMEDRHVRWLEPYVVDRPVQVVLLGLWCRPRFALLYDPYEQPREYFATCLDRIQRAVSALLAEAAGRR